MREYLRKQRGSAPYGTPEAEARRLAALPRKDNHHNWKGDEAKYRAVHQWLELNYPKTGCCEDCGSERLTQYAYLGEPGGHERNRLRYRELCVPCHSHHDRRQRAKRDRILR